VLRRFRALLGLATSWKGEMSIAPRARLISI